MANPRWSPSLGHVPQENWTAALWRRVGSTVAIRQGKEIVSCYTCLSLSTKTAMSVCRSVGLSVCRSVGLSVCRSVNGSIIQLVSLY